MSYLDIVEEGGMLFHPVVLDEEDSRIFVSAFLHLLVFVDDQKLSLLDRADAKKRKVEK